MSSVFDASAPWSKSSALFCTTEFVPLKGNLVFHERTSNGGWRAFVTDPTCICRHGSSFHSSSEPAIDNFNLQFLNHQLSFSILIHVLGAAPIKVPFWPLHNFFRSSKKCLLALKLFLRGTYIRNYMVLYWTRLWLSLPQEIMSLLTQNEWKSVGGWGVLLEGVHVY